MPIKLSSPVTDIPRIGPTKAKYLKKLGITHARDFLYTFPRRHDDFSKVTSISELKAGEKMTVKGRVKSVDSKWGWRGRQRILRIFVELDDGTGVLSVTWYNLRFLPRQLWPGRELLVAGVVEQPAGAGGKSLPFDKGEPSPPQRGRVELAPRGNASGSFAGAGARQKFRLRSPVLEFADKSGARTHTARITPVYPETYGVTSRFLRYQVSRLLPLARHVPEYLPAEIRRRHRLMGIKQAVRAAHFPETSEELERAGRRLRFDELFFLQLAALVRKQRRHRQQAPPVKVPQNKVDKFMVGFPYRLTDAQKRACREVAADMAGDIPMNRLLQGDVGSGKSAVAFLAVYLALAAGHAAVYLAPTEILARQQARALSSVLKKQNVRLLIGASKTAEKKAIKEKLRAGDPLCAVGTHALLQEDVALANCALIIIDEQHRFGVRQRAALLGGRTPAGSSREKQSNSSPSAPEPERQTKPHLLSMTATPIPRTLNLTVYGDLDVSVLDELPPGRKPVKTAVIPPSRRDEAAVHILEEIHKGRQAYVIAPLVEESEKLEVKSAKETAVEMKQMFPDVAVGLLHGQMSSEEKKTAINNFSAGALQLLVSTAVVEVGVDVRGATIMIIEGAERFGLAQLHQFRGRIGRGEHQSYCYLFPGTEEGARSPRLEIMAKTADGFTIAEKDLKLRGPGEAYGVAQSGYGDLKVASLLDYALIKETRREASRLLSHDSELDGYPVLKMKVEQKNSVAHFE